jgi:hypothetical protein
MTEDPVEDETERHSASQTQSGSNRRNIVGLAVVVILAGLGWLLVRELQAKSKLEDCMLSGRRDCAPISDTN